jgi:exodeoxyribonuclease V beta subunit
VPIDRILVVTFTRAAAAELRDRIRARIAGAAAALTGDADLDDDLLRAIAAQTPGGRAVAARRLEQAVVDFDTATITTIHGFAQQVRTALGTTAPGDLDADLDDDTRVLVAQVCTDLLAAAVVGADAASVETLPSLDRLTKTVTFVLGNPGIAAVPAPAPASGDDPGAAPDPAAAAATTRSTPSTVGAGPPGVSPSTTSSPSCETRSRTATRPSHSCATASPSR